MNIGLYQNGDYKIFKNTKKMYKKKEDFKYVVLDSSTGLKGPLHTLVNVVCSEEYMKNVDILIKVSYNANDCPFSDTSTIKSHYDINSIEKFYSIYPLVRQMLNFNTFKNDFEYIDNEMNVDRITMHSDNFEIELDEEVEDDVIRKAFKEIKMMTYVRRAFKSRYLILDNDTWFFSKVIPKKFDYIGIEIEDMESFYLLTEEEYKRFRAITHLRIDFDNSTIYTDTYYHDLIETMYPADNHNYMECMSLKSILETAIFLPQLLILEQYVYNSSAFLQLEIDTLHKSYHLNITDKETQSGICLFDIINKLLQF